MVEPPDHEMGLASTLLDTWRKMRINNNLYKLDIRGQVCEIEITYKLLAYLWLVSLWCCSSARTHLIKSDNLAFEPSL